MGGSCRKGKADDEDDPVEPVGNGHPDFNPEVVDLGEDEDPPPPSKLERELSRSASSLLKKAFFDDDDESDEESGSEESDQVMENDDTQSRQDEDESSPESDQSSGEEYTPKKPDYSQDEGDESPYNPPDVEDVAAKVVGRQSEMGFSLRRVNRRRSTTPLPVRERYKSRSQSASPTPPERFSPILERRRGLKGQLNTGPVIARKIEKVNLSVLEELVITIPEQRLIFDPLHQVGNAGLLLPRVVLPPLSQEMAEKLNEAAVKLTTPIDVPSANASASQSVAGGSAVQSQVTGPIANRKRTANSPPLRASVTR